jgi:hypothetical protein
MDSYIITAHIDFVLKELFGQPRDNIVIALSCWEYGINYIF